MPRNVRDSNLETRTARSRLKVAHKPYFRLIEPGLHLGYRKLANGPGTWVVRSYDRNERTYAVKNLKTRDERLVFADDYTDADGRVVLSFAQAQQRAKAYRPGATADDGGAFTVAKAMGAYFRHLESEGRAAETIRDARWRDEAFIRPKLGNTEAATLTAERLRKWRDDLAQMAPRLRTKEGEPQKHRTDNSNQRARRSSANRTWTILRAALNRAFENSKVSSDVEWRKVKPFKKVDAARQRYLTVAEAKRLINACDPDFRLLVRAALQTGARYGELVRLLVSDFNPDVGTLHIRQSKSGKTRDIVLTDEGRALFEQITAGRSGDNHILQKAGAAWQKSHQARPMADAVARAKIKPAISFHGLRHTWASLAVMNGVPLMVVARNLGHADTRMVERHYGHLREDYVTDEIRKGAPRFGKMQAAKVVSLGRR